MKKNIFKKVIFSLLAIMLIVVQVSVFVSALDNDVSVCEDHDEHITMAVASGCDHTPTSMPKEYTWTCPHGGYSYFTGSYCTKCNATLGYGSASVACPQGLCIKP